MGNLIEINPLLFDKDIIQQDHPNSTFGLEPDILSDKHKLAIMKRFHQICNRVTIKDLDEIKVEVPQKLLEVSGNHEFISKLKKRIRLLYQILFDINFVNTRLTISAAAGLKYFLSPVDFLNDEIPGIGYLDDAYVLWEIFVRNREAIITYLQTHNQKLEEYL